MRFLDLVGRPGKPSNHDGSESAEFPPELSLRDLKEMLPAIACGELEMTEAILLQLIEFTNPSIGPDGLNEDECERWHDEWMDSWISQAKPQWLDLLIGIMRRPEDWWTEFLRGKGDLWLNCFEEWLVAIALKDPGTSVHKLAIAIPSTPTRLRPNLITAVGSLGDPGGLPILDHLLAQESLPPAQIVALAIALADLGGAQSLQRLNDLVAALDAGRKCRGAPYFVLMAREEAHRQRDRVRHLA